MNRLVHLAILCCIIGLVSSCEKDPFLSLNSPNTITFSEQGGTQIISFTTNRDWTVSSSESWCTVSPSSGLKSDGKLSFTITCAPNTTFDSRSASVTIKGEELMETISVTQDTNLGILVSHTSYYVSNAEQTIEVEVKANVEYEIKPKVDWIHYVETKGLTSSTINLYVDKNTFNDQRIGEVEVLQRNGNLKGTIKVTQAERDRLLIDQDYYALSSDAQLITIGVESNVDYSVSSDVDWLFVSDDMAPEKVVVRVQRNYDSESYRIGHITLSQIDGDLFTEVTIAQDGISGTLYSKEPFFSECMDLLSLIWRLAGAPEYNECKVSKVSESADAFFASMKNHEAVRLAKEYRYSGVSYDAVATYGLYLLISNDGSIIFNPCFDGSDNSSLKRWPGNSKQEMLVALNDFYQKSNFHEWYTSLESLHIQAIESFKSKTSIEYEWFDHFYGPVNKLSTQIILSFLNGLSSYGISTGIAYGGTLLSPVLGMFRQDNAGGIYYSNSNPIGVIHEFSHPYCNPLVDKYWESMKEKANAVFKTVETQMRSQAYSKAKTMMYETLVRACTVDYLITHGYGSEKERTIQNYESKGFVLVRCVVDALEKREQNWSKYPTLDDFMPEIVKAINDCQL